MPFTSSAVGCCTLRLAKQHSATSQVRAIEAESHVGRSAFVWGLRCASDNGRRTISTLLSIWIGRVNA